MTDNNAEVLKDLEQMMKGLERLDKASGEVVVKDSKHILAKKKNTVGAVQVSPTATEARNAARHRNAVLQQPFNETNTPPEELEAAALAEIDAFLEDIVNNALGIR